MPEPSQSLATWTRQHLVFSNSRQAWEDRAALLVLILGGGALLFFASGLPLSRQVLLWGFLLAVLAVLMRRGWLKVFGPVLIYDVIRSSRRTRYFFMRFLYTCGLGLLICYFYYVFWLRIESMEGKPTIKEQALFAEIFFYTFMWVQFLAVVLLTPAYTAGAIADEKEKKTLEFLLATDLHNREIVLGKWLARVGNLTLLLLAGIPVLAMNLFLGGVDPDLMVAGFTATALTLVSLAGVSIVLSVFGRKTRDAIVLTYLVLLTYYALSSVFVILTFSLPAFGPTVLIPLGSYTVTVADVVQVFASGNIFVVLINLARMIGFGGGVPADVLVPLLRDYAIFHGLVTLGCVSLAVNQLRAVALRQQGVVPKTKGSRFSRNKPIVGSYPPMVWKEVFADAGHRTNMLGRILALLLVGLSFLPFFMIVYFFFENSLSGRGRFSGDWDQFGQATNVWARIAGMLVACLTLLAVAVRASGSISIERDKQTIDSLLTTPLTTADILWGKWLGSVASQRWGLAWVSVIWLTGIATGGMHPLVIIPLLLAWFVYAGVIGLLGLWFSLVCKTTLRATVWSVLSTIFCAIGHWMLWSCCMPIFMLGRSGGRIFDDIGQVMVKLQSGLSPPVVLVWLLPWRTEDFFKNYGGTREDFSPPTLMAYALVGLVVWAVAGLFLWTALKRRFDRVTSRGNRAPEGVRRARKGQTA